MSCMCKSVCMRGHKLSIFFKIWTSPFYVSRGEFCEDTFRDFLKNKLKIIDEIPFERVHRVGKTKRVQYQAKKHCRQVQLYQRPRTRPEASMPSFKPPPPPCIPVFQIHRPAVVEKRFIMQQRSEVFSRAGQSLLDKLFHGEHE